MRKRDVWVWLSTALSAALLVAIAPPARAAAEDAEESRPYADTPCAEDSLRLCSSVEVGTASLWSCFEGNKKRGALSQQCSDYFDEVSTERRAVSDRRYAHFMEVCNDDVDRICSEWKEKRQALTGCLMRNHEQVSPECNAVRPNRVSKHRGTFRFRDGSEPEDWDYQMALKHRPRKTLGLLTPEQIAARDEMIRAKTAEVQAAHVAREKAAPGPASESDAELPAGLP
jgi:hypothetical protein